MVPQFAAVFFDISAGREKRHHCVDYRGGADVSLLAVFYGGAVVHHILYVAPVFGQNEFLQSVVICEHIFL